MDRLHGLYRPQIVRCQNVKSQSLIRSWKSINSQSSAITINPSRLTAASLMSKHALWQIYGYMGNTAKLSKKKNTKHFFHALSSSSKKDKQGEGDAFKDLRWCSDVMFNWLRFGFKGMSAHSKNNVFYGFMWGSKRIIYNISDCQANMHLNIALRSHS